MEDDIDIYEDLPSFNLKDDGNNVEKSTNTACECAELKKRVDELTQKLENVQKVNKNLEVNLEALLNTAKAEITRKDKMINSLRKQLDNAAFRRGQFARPMPNCTRQHFLTSKQNISSSSQSNISEIPPMPMAIDSVKPIGQNLEEEEDTEQQWEPQKYVNTVFGERLRKRLMDEQNEEKRQSNKQQLNVDASKVPKEYIAESDKENGSVININNKENQLRLTARNANNTDKINVQCKVNDPSITSSSNPPDESNINTGAQHRPALTTKFSGKRPHEDSTAVPNNKRCKTESDEHKISNSEKHQKGDKWLNSVPESWNNGYSVKKIDPPKNVNHKNLIDTEDVKKSHFGNKNKKYERKKDNAPESTCAHHDRKDNEYKSDRIKSSSGLRHHRNNGNNSDPENNSHKHESKGNFCSRQGNHRCNNSNCKCHSKNRDNAYDRSKCHRYNRDQDFKSSNRRYDRYRTDKYDNEDKYDRRRECKNKYPDREDDFNKKSYDLRSKVKHRQDDRNSNVESGSFINHQYRYQRWNDDRSSTSTSERSRSRSHENINYNVSMMIAERSNLDNKKDEAVIDHTKGTSKSELKVKIATLEESDVKTTEAENMYGLEDGEIIDSPSPIKENVHTPCTPIESYTPRNPFDVDIDKTNPPMINNVNRENSRSPFVQIEYGSRSSVSMKEEKIENIEKFIKDYTHDSKTLSTFDKDKHNEKEITEEHKSSDIKNILDTLNPNDNCEIHENLDIPKNTENKELARKDVDNETKNANSNKKSHENKVDNTETADINYEKIESSKNNEIPEKCVEIDTVDVNIENKKSEICLEKNTTEQAVPEDFKKPDEMIITNNENIDLNVTDSKENKEENEQYENVSDENVETKNEQEILTEDLHNSNNTESEKSSSTSIDVTVTSSESSTVNTSSSDNNKENNNKTITSENDIPSRQSDASSKNSSGSSSDIHSFVTISDISEDRTPKTSSATESSISPTIEKRKDANDKCELNEKQKVMPVKAAISKNDVSVRTQNKVVVLARRRKPVQLADNNASMTIVVSANNAKPNNNLNNPCDANASLKPRACKMARSYKDILSK